MASEEPIALLPARALDRRTASTTGTPQGRGSDDQLGSIESELATERPITSAHEDPRTASRWPSIGHRFCGARWRAMA
jgi:hypothetical protein